MSIIIVKRFMMKYGVPVQKKIYTNGMAGKKPIIPTDFFTLESKARDRMSPEAFAYVSGGAGLETTVDANRKAFDRYPLMASMMKAVPMVDLGVELFGKKHESPLFAAPIGALDLVHPGADRIVARACRTVGIPMIFSNQAAVSMEECSEELMNTPRWFQLYWSKSDDLVMSFVRRAEHCKCDALVVTLDTTSLGWRSRDLNLGYLPFLRGLGLAQYSSDPVFNKIVHQNMQQPDENSETPPVNLRAIRNVLSLCRRYPGGFLSNLRSGRALAAVKTFIDIYMRPELRWADLDRLRRMTNLPILVKGIQTVDDARLAFDSGVDGIIVSNHGGRQIDGGTGALICLDRIMESGVTTGPVLFDSGIKAGADVIKALALGAKAVLVGRSFVYGLALAGEKGVGAVFMNILAELELQLSLMGISRIQDLDRKVFLT